MEESGSVAAETPSMFSAQVINSVKGRGLVATKPISEGDIIFTEEPLVSAQFLWNKSCKYAACDHCLRPLETVEENIRRLTKDQNFVLPFPSVLNSKCFEVIPCSQACSSVFCSTACRDTAWNTYHKLLCLGKCGDGYENHPIVQLEEAWKTMHYPPESFSISLLSRIISSIRSAENVENALQKYRSMCSGLENETTSGLAHKLLGAEFRQRIEVLHALFNQAFYGDDLKQVFTPEGFTSLLALVSRNGQGIGTSPLADWVASMEKEKESLAPAQQKAIDDLIDQIYEKIDEETGLDFMNAEGSGLYEIQSYINHSCEPNAEIRFPFGSHRLAVVAKRDIKPGEEICSSYLDECDLTRSRHSRSRILKENYVFVCECSKCLAQASDPDVTSDEEDEDMME